MIYVADKFQLAAEAIIPINRASGDDVGVIGQMHFYLDDIFPQLARQADLRQANATEHYHDASSIAIAFWHHALRLATAAQAHAMLDHASPAVGSTVAGRPAVTLYFTENSSQSSAEARCTTRRRPRRPRRERKRNVMRLSVGVLLPAPTA